MQSRKVTLEDLTFGVSWSKEQKRYVARCVEFPHIVGEAPFAPQALEIVRKHIRAELRQGNRPASSLKQRSFTGKVEVWLTSEEHKQLYASAALVGMTLDQFLRDILVNHRPAEPLPKKTRKRVVTQEVIKRATELRKKGLKFSEIATVMGLPTSTVWRAARLGVLH
jgi:hypothetical protein